MYADIYFAANNSKKVALQKTLRHYELETIWLRI